MTLQNLFQEYIAGRKYEVRESTLRQTTRLLESNILPSFGKVDIRNLTNLVLQNRKNQVSKLPLANQIKQNIYCEFRVLQNYAVKMDYLPKNSLTKIGNFKEPYFETQHDMLRYYADEQFLSFIFKQSLTVKR